MDTIAVFVSLLICHGLKINTGTVIVNPGSASESMPRTPIGWNIGIVSALHKAEKNLDRAGLMQPFTVSRVWFLCLKSIECGGILW
jgi:hypothetical protein